MPQLSGIDEGGDWWIAIEEHQSSARRGGGGSVIEEKAVIGSFVGEDGVLLADGGSGGRPTALPY